MALEPQIYPVHIPFFLVNIHDGLPVVIDCMMLSGK
jgi:hypothetical protein